MLTIVFVLASIALLLIVGAVQKRWPRLRYLAPRLLVTYLTFLMPLVLGELYFRYIYAESGWGFTLAYQNWERRYWETNSLGFRDREWTAEDVAGKTKILVIGDSFTAGWGVQDPADRYPNVLQDLLGDEYAVMIAAKPGGTPMRELDWLKSYPIQPDIVIYQYYLNDIDDAALRINDFWQPQFERPPYWMDQESYLANFLYWRFAPLYTTVNAADGSSYWDWNQRAYDNFVIWEDHKRELNEIMAYVESIGARLIVVIFPNMQDAIGSIGRVDAVASAFEQNGHEDVLKLFDLVAAWNPEDVVVSERDAHPSAEFHHKVGQTLYETFFAPGEDKK